MTTHLGTGESAQETKPKSMDWRSWDDHYELSKGSQQNYRKYIWDIFSCLWKTQTFRYKIHLEPNGHDQRRISPEFVS